MKFLSCRFTMHQSYLLLSSHPRRTFSCRCILMRRREQPESDSHSMGALTEAAMSCHMPLWDAFHAAESIHPRCPEWQTILRLSLPCIGLSCQLERLGVNYFNQIDRTEGRQSSRPFHLFLCCQTSWVREPVSHGSRNSPNVTGQFLFFLPSFFFLFFLLPLPMFSLPFLSFHSSLLFKENQ